MPSVGVKLYSVFFKLLLKHRLQSRFQTPDSASASLLTGITSRPEEPLAAPNPTFSPHDGVATKDIHIDSLTSLSVRIFLPFSVRPAPAASSKDCRRRPGRPPLPRGVRSASDPEDNGSTADSPRRARFNRIPRRGSYDGAMTKMEAGDVYGGYLPPMDGLGDGGGGGGHSVTRKLPVIVQFHGGAFVGGSNCSVANDLFCRRIAKLLDVIVVAVGYRLAPESRYPAAFDDGFMVLKWLAKQANLAECSKSMEKMRPGAGAGGGGVELRRSDMHGHVVDAFGASMAEPWLAAHGDPSRCVLLGVSCGANIADFVARKAVEAGRLLDPVKVVAQVLMCPFFVGSVPTHSEIRLANSYFYDKSMCILAWKLFLPEGEFGLDHPAANPLAPGRGGGGGGGGGCPPLKRMPPTLTVVAEHDWMRDRAIAYSEELRRVNVDAPVLDYKDAVHEFATLDMLLKTPEAQACAEDVAIWVRKYISTRGHEFSY